MPTFVEINTDSAYIGRRLWLPKKHINSRAVKAALEFPVIENGEFSFMQVWDDAQDHIIVPRSYISEATVRERFNLIDVRPPRYPKIEVGSKIVLDSRTPGRTTQHDAYRSMQRSSGGILNLACGLGKTVIALHLVARRKVPTLVIVNNTTLINQWSARISEFLDIDTEVGVIQNNPSKWKWEGLSIVVAMIHSLALHSGNLPAGIEKYFGLIVYDEVHHLSAPLFSRSASIFFGERHGLTATTDREDGLESIYQYNIGPVYHRDMAQDLTPRIYFQQSNLHVNMSSPDVKEQVYDKREKLSLGKLRTYLGTLQSNNAFIKSKLQAPLRSGRKILVLGHSVEQLEILHDMVENSGLCIGSVKPDVRITELRDKQIIFGTLQLVQEALDEPTLDTLFFLTPFGSSYVENGGFNTLQQGMGRIQRVREGKKTPVVVLMDHIYVPSFHRMCSQLKRQLHSWPADQGGPLEYKIIKPTAGVSE